MRVKALEYFPNPWLVMKGLRLRILPLAAVLAAEEFGGFGIADDLFLVGVPLDAAAGFVA